MSQKIDISLLQKVSLLEGLSKPQLKSVLKETNFERFAAGKTIVTEGSPGGRMFLILEGLAKVQVGGKNRSTMGPGDFFGEMSLIDKGPRAATVIAETELTALSLASWNFLALLQEHWSMNQKVLKVLASRIRELDRSLTR